MKKLSYLLSCMALAVSVAFVGCKEPEPAPIVVPPEGGEPLEIPQVVEPGAGKVTLVVHVPDGTCNGIVAVGQNGTEAYKLKLFSPLARMKGSCTSAVRRAISAFCGVTSRWSVK